MSQALISCLKANKGNFAAVTPFDFTKTKPYIFDFTAQNEELKAIDLNDEEAFNKYVFGKLAAHRTPVGLGIYDEDREIYKRSDHFSGSSARSIHLGIDIWAKAGTAVFAPLAGKVHSFKNNKTHGDYGPTLILSHKLDGIEFYTLYGHLSLPSISDKTIGQVIEKGQQIATLGSYDINVHWPPHLHFQCIKSMDNYFGDYPGVCSKMERTKYLELCPDPNLLLNIEALD